MCWKVDHMVECLACGYPFSEALYYDTGRYNCEGQVINEKAQKPSMLDKIAPELNRRLP